MKNRTLKYYQLKKFNILLGLVLAVLHPGFVYAWLSGGLAINEAAKVSALYAWSSPGMLSFPIAVAVLGFIVGVVMLLFVWFKADIDEILPGDRYD